MIEQIGLDICVRSGRKNIGELYESNKNNAELNESEAEDIDQLQELINIQKQTFTAGVYSTTFQKILELDAQTERYNKDSKKIRDSNVLEFYNRKDKERWEKSQLHIADE